jgi:DNA-binding transcriptional LysR family regulator
MLETMSNPQTLAWFMAVAKTANFRKAADLLEVPVATLSRRITQFEKELGVKLFQRNTRQVALTALGQQLLSGLAQPLAEIDSLLLRVSGAQQAVAGTVRLTTTQIIAETFLPQVVVDLASQYPQLRMELLTEEVVLDMRAQSIDVALRAGSIKDDSLIGRIAFHSVFYRYAAPKWVGQAYVPRLCYYDEPNLENAQMVCSNMRTVFACALAGAGYAVLPQELCQVAVSRGELIQLERQPEAVYPVHLLYPSRDYLPAKVQAVVAAILKHAELYKLSVGSIVD